mgnify:CR=1 FL=1
MFFKNYKVWETELAGRKLTLETGKMCGLAGASIMARYGDTNVLCNVTMSAKPREGVDFFPLSVDYEEKMYWVGSPVLSSAVRPVLLRRPSSPPAALTAPFVPCSPRICATM